MDLSSLCSVWAAMLLLLLLSLTQKPTLLTVSFFVCVSVRVCVCVVCVCVSVRLGPGLAKAGEGPKQSVFGLGGDAASSPFVADTRTYFSYYEFQQQRGREGGREAGVCVGVCLQEEGRVG